MVDEIKWYMRFNSIFDHSVPRIRFRLRFGRKLYPCPSCFWYIRYLFSAAGVNFPFPVFSPFQKQPSYRSPLAQEKAPSPSIRPSLKSPSQTSPFLNTYFPFPSLMPPFSDPSYSSPFAYLNFPSPSGSPSFIPPVQVSPFSYTLSGLTTLRMYFLFLLRFLPSLLMLLFLRLMLLLILILLLSLMLLLTLLLLSTLALSLPDSSNSELSGLLNFMRAISMRELSLLFISSMNWFCFYMYFLRLSLLMVLLPSKSSASWLSESLLGCSTMTSLKVRGVVLTMDFLPMQWTMTLTTISPVAMLKSQFQGSLSSSNKLSMVSSWKSKLGGTFCSVRSFSYRFFLDSNLIWRVSSQSFMLFWQSCLSSWCTSILLLQSPAHRSTQISGISNNS